MALYAPSLLLGQVSRRHGSPSFGLLAYDECCRSFPAPPRCRPSPANRDSDGWPLFMKVAILAGGLGSRLAEETETLPKPLVPIGELPILWHIMKYFATYEHDQFVIALGYKGNVIKRFATEMMQLAGNIRIDYASRQIRYDGNEVGPWVVDLVETGLRTNTGGRIRQLMGALGGGRFFLTYGDGLADVDLAALLAFHRHHGRIATLTAVRPPARFGHLELEDDTVAVFDEKPQAAEGWINGGFFVLEPEVFDYIDDDMIFEQTPLRRLAEDGQLMAYRHGGFWQCMDTLRDKRLLEQLWRSGRAPWKTWN
jgi:glucose-1-phosphate cytidylyltransferase